VKWIKAPEALKERLESLMQGVDCEKRPMFGYPAYFINKNMFAGLFGDKVFLRLSPDQAASLKLPNLQPMPGRPMKDYYELPEKLHTDTRRVSKIIQEAAEYCQTLPAKASKPKKKK
jgi:TfoX/Sxy family transcriptional regulator of competence genes